MSRSKDRNAENILKQEIDHAFRLFKVMVIKSLNKRFLNDKYYGAYRNDNSANACVNGRKAAHKAGS